MTTAHVVWQAITPMHIGTGQDGSGIVDLPQAREASTGYPILPASGLKGVIRNAKEAAHPEGGTDATLTWFGSSERAGDLVFHDGRLLALPVPSLWGTFALVTCPLVLTRLKRDLNLLGFPTKDFTIPSLPGERGMVPADSQVTHEGRVLIDDFIVEVDEGQLTSLIRLLAKGSPDLDKTLAHRLCILPDDVFAFLARYRLPISPHVKINEESGVVENGALWYEEVIPEEALLTSFVTGTKADPAKVLEGTQLLQVGGLRTVGRGLVSLHVRESGGL